MHSEFRVGEADGPVASDRSEGGAETQRELLLFEFGGELYAVSATRVDGVVAWKPPTSVPGADARVSGVIQDRGRIVVVMFNADGRIRRVLEETPRRVIVCTTGRGLVGLPASSTRAVGPVLLSAEPEAFSVHSSPFGTFTYLDMDEYDRRD
jgi:hypothetical protein